jgi:hypothetical protein
VSRLRLAAAGVALAGLAGAAPISSQTPRPKIQTPFRPLRFEESYDFLRDSVRHGWWRPLKYVRVGDWSALSFGGEVRARYERLDHPAFGALPSDGSGYALERLMLHGDWRIGRPLRVFAQVASALEQGRTGGPRPVDEDSLRLHQAFVEYRHRAGGVQAWGRLGRQEVSFGRSRTFATRDPANVRRSFDAMRGGIAGAGVAVNLFWGREVRVGPGWLDDRRDSMRVTWGTAATLDLRPQRQWLDVYLFRDRRDSARFAQGTAASARWTAGAVYRGAEGRWEWNVETLYQWGRFGTAAARASVTILDVAHTFPVRWRPRLALRGSRSSGDRDATEPVLQSLDPLYPRGFVLSGGPVGPGNLTNVHPTLDLQLTDRLSLYLDADWFWRTRATDGIYDQAGQLVRTADTTRSRYIGMQPWLQVDWFISEYFRIEVGYGHFFAGAAIRESGPAREMNFFGASAVFTF